MWYIERLDGEADMRFFLPFINLDIRQIYKHVKQHFFTQHFFWKIQLFLSNMYNLYNIIT